jgi:2-methylisocitrate lyase-like PEP mutase family enzyme
MTEFERLSLLESSLYRRSVPFLRSKDCSSQQTLPLHYLFEPAKTGAAVMPLSQKEKARQFKSLHNSSSLFVLPNAWDVVSARIFEQEGFQAIGTTSAGVAAVLGYPDGQRMDLEENLAIIGRIAERTDLPVSADIEAGYAASAAGVVEAAQKTLAVGAVGINLEDGTGKESCPLFDIPVMQERIRGIRAMADQSGIPLVINARTDVYLLPDTVQRNRLERTLERADCYVQAGADCIFVPDVGALDRPTIATLVREINSPINIIAGPGTPSLPELEQLGVSRVSLGPRPMRAALSLLQRLAREIQTSGTFELMNAEGLSYAEINRMLEH